MPVMRAYLKCLAYPYVKYLIVTNLLGRLPNGMGTLAVVLFLRAGHVGYVQVGVLTAVYALATAIGGPLLGRLVDRVGQAQVLFCSALGSAAGFVALALLGTDRPVAAGAAVILAGTLTPPLEPCLRSLWPDVLPDQETVATAYALDAALQELVFVAGPLLVVGVGAVLNPVGAVYATAALVLVGTSLFVLAEPVRRWRSQPRVPDWIGPLRSRPLRVLLYALFGVGTALGVINIAFVGYADGHGRSGLAGVLLGASALGALIGGLTYGARSWPGEPAARLPLLFGLLALGYWPLLAAPAPVSMTALSVLSGLFLAPVLACAFVVIGQTAPVGTVTEGFAWVITTFIVGSAAGSALAGPLLEQAGLRWTLLLPGVVTVLSFAVVAGSGAFRSGSAGRPDSALG
jgi:MFS family permease